MKKTQFFVSILAITASLLTGCTTGNASIASESAYIPFASMVTSSNGITGKCIRIVLNKRGIVESDDVTETKI